MFPDNLTISVTQEDIDTPRDETKAWCSVCPIALATKRVVKDCYVSVGISCLTLFNGENQRSYSLPIEAQNFINRVDGGIPAHPFTFTTGGEYQPKP
jgi:hypothetical protein